MMKKFLPFLLYASLLIGIVSCVTPFEAEVPFAENSLSVQAYLSNIPGDTRVILQRIAPFTVDALLIAEEKAQVWVSDQKGGRINFLEKERGIYFPLDPGFVAKSDEKYTLNFSTSDGQNYRSSAENMPVSIPISKVYYEPRYENRIVEGRIQTAWDVLLDTQDPAELGNYYRWDWVHYETTPFCDTYFGRGFGGGPDQLNGVSCCQQPCYEKQACTQNCVNIGNDVLFNGKKLSRIPIQTIPHCVIEYYIEVQQRSINQGAYDYWKAVAQLSANTGGVFDIAPAAVRSNIRNLSEPNKKVYGYFEVSNVVEVGLFLDRIAPGPALLNCKPYPIPQPFGCAPCQGLNRSTVKPRYWTK
jgi:Domain of unknown function (DUF4249)